MPTPFPSSDHLSPTRAQGFRQTVACLWTWQTTKPLTPERRDIAPEFIGVTDCRVLDWCVAAGAASRHHQLAFEWIGSVLAVAIGFVGGCWVAVHAGIWLSHRLLHLSTY